MTDNTDKLEKKLTKEAFKHMKAMDDKAGVPLLELLDIIPIAETTKKFVVCEYLAGNTQPDAEVKISDLGESFKRFRRKIEEPSPVTMLYRYGVARFFVKEEWIIAKLGGEVKAETHLAQMFPFLKQKQESGEVEVFFRHWNVFFSRDAYGSLRSVRVTWDISHHGYVVGTFPIGKYYLYKDDLVFSPNPDLEPL